MRPAGTMVRPAPLAGGARVGASAADAVPISTAARTEVSAARCIAVMFDDQETRRH